MLDPGTEVAGTALVPFGRKSQEPPAGAGGAREEFLNLGALLARALSALFASHITYLTGPRTGAHDRREAGVQETAPLLKSYLAALLGVVPGDERDELFRMIDLVMEAGLVPPRIQMPPAAGAVDWTGKL